MGWSCSLRMTNGARDLSATLSYLLENDRVIYFSVASLPFEGADDQLKSYF